MATVIMPKMGDAMEEGTLLKWLKSAGDEVAEGDPIAEIETDKVTLEIEAPEDGFLTNTLVEEGAIVPIGTAVATIGAEGEVGQTPDAPAGGEGADAAEEKEKAAGVEESAVADAVEQTPELDAADEPAPADAPASPAPSRDAAAASMPSQSQVAERKPGERLRASPLVKRLAEEHGIDLTQVTGSGPGGRIIKNDINDFVSGAKPAPRAADVAPQAPTAAPAATNGQADQSAPTSPEAAPAAAPESGPVPVASGKGTKVELARIRRTTGKRMAESKQTIPHYYVTSTVDMTEALAFRARVNQSLGESGGRVSVNDLIVKAAALALKEHPNVNTSFESGELYQHDNIDINFAIAIDGGLIAPFVPAADEKSLGSIARLTKDLGKRAREGGLTPDEFQGGTFTISNLGMFDVDEFIAVINPPQAAILAVGSVQDVPVVKDGEIAVGSVMKLTLSADHRALDGAQVATFLQTVKRYLEAPMLLAIS